MDLVFRKKNSLNPNSARGRGGKHAHHDHFENYITILKICC